MIRTRDDLSFDEVSRQIRYCPKTGEFFRFSTGKNVLSKDNDGYRVVRLNKKWYQGGRLAFLLMNKEWPLGYVDHINGIRDDNKWENLRVVSNAENQQNKRASCRNTTGYLGVYPRKGTNKFVARIRIDGKRKYLGLFDTPEEAHKAYIAEKINLHAAYNPRRNLLPS